VPYRDFVERIGPGLPYWNAALIAVFGDSLAVPAWGGWAMGCALTLALHAVCGAVARAPWRLLPPVVFATLVYPPFDLGSHKWPALLLALLAVVALGRRGALPAVVAGVACGLAAAFTPALGLAAIAGCWFHLRREGPGPAAGAFPAAAAGTIAMIAAPLAFAAGAGPVAEGWLGGVLAPDRAIGLPGRWSLQNAAYLVLAASAAAAGLAASWPRESRPDREMEAAERLVARCGIALLIASLAGHLDPYALAVHSTLLAAAAAAAAGRVAASDRPLVWTRRAATAVLAFCVVSGAGWLVLWRQRLQPLVLQTFRGGDTWIGARNEELPWLESRTRPGEPTFVFPAGGGGYFLTRTRDATSLPYAIEGMHSEDQQRRALAEIAASRPRAGIWMGGQRFVPAAGRPRLDVLYEGIVRSYAAERVLPDGTLLLRRKD
jgi:hypothetical protein